jgi:Ca-activated chloride channel family protein
MMFRFASPLYLLLLLAFLPASYFWFKQASAHIRISSLEGTQAAAQTVGVTVSKMVEIIKHLALVLLIIALARPQWGDRKTTITTQGVNIILALDLSESMRALDFKQDDQIVNRLQAVKSVVHEFIMKREGDRIGMVVFGSHAFTQLPLTRDYQTIAFVLDRLKIGAAGPKTAIGDAIGISLKRLEDIKSKSNIIVLLTDGKSNSGQLSWQDAAAIAAQRNVKIYTVGVGSKGQAPFLVDGLFGKRYVYRQVDVDLDALRSIARKTDGRFFEADDMAALHQIYQMIDQLEKTKVDVDKWVEYKEFYPGVLAAGLGCLVLSLLLSNTRFIRIP